MTAAFSRRTSARSATAALADQMHQLAKANLRQHQSECGRCGVTGADVLNYCEAGYRMAQAVTMTGRKAKGGNTSGQGAQERML